MPVLGYLRPRLEGEPALLATVGAFVEADQLVRPVGVGVERPEPHRHFVVVADAERSGGEGHDKVEGTLGRRIRVVSRPQGNMAALYVLITTG